MQSELPSGWRHSTVGNECEVLIGGTPSRKVTAYWDREKSGSNRWASISDLHHPWVGDTAEYITDQGVAESSVKLIKTGTVLMSFKLTIGRTALAGTDLYTNEAIAAFVPRSSSVDMRYVYYALPLAAEAGPQDQAVKGRTLNKQKIIALRLLLPPLAEQKKIAAILSSVDEAIQANETVIEQTRRVKDGVLEALLARGLGRSEQQESALGPLPRAWRVERLPELCSWIGVGIASSATHAYRSSGVPLVRNQNIRPGLIDLKDLLFVSPEYDCLNQSKRLQAGDVLTIRTGYPGVSAVVPKVLDRAQCFTTLISRPRQELVDPYFLAEWINSARGRQFVLAGKAGGAQHNLNAGTLKKLLVPLPPLQEQRKIVEICANVSAAARDSEQLVERLAILKAGLLQDLLTGKVRVST